MTTGQPASLGEVWEYYFVDFNLNRIMMTGSRSSGIVNSEKKVSGLAQKET
jgi:hypothetical protein